MDARKENQDVIRVQSLGKVENEMNKWGGFVVALDTEEALCERYARGLAGGF